MANYTPYSSLNYTPANANYTSAYTGLPAYSPQPGSVKGVSTTNTQSQQNNQQQQQNDVNGNENSPSLDLSPYYGALDEMSGLVDVFGQEQTGSIGTLANEQAGQVRSEEQKQLGRIEGYRGEARQEKKTTLRDLSQDLINAMQAGQVYLGGIGAGASSAVGRMTGALAKAGNQRATDVHNTFSTIMNKINLKEEDVKTTVQQELSNIRQWKDSKTQEIIDWVNQQKIAIQGMRADAQMLASQTALQQAYDKLNSVEQNAANYNNALNEWAISRSENLAQLRTNIQGAAQYQVPGIGYQRFNNAYKQSPASRTYTPGIGRANEEENKFV